MHCPKCGQAQVSADTRYCSRCGFLLTAISQIVENDGLPLMQPTKHQKVGWRHNPGFKLGLLIFLLTFLVVPILTMISIAVRAQPFIAVIAAVLFGLGGLLKMAWALLFESEQNHKINPDEIYVPASRKIDLLPEMRDTPANAYVSPVGAWRDTNELEPRGSVTDPTTKFLVNDSKDQ